MGNEHKICPSCYADLSTPFHSIENIPVNSVLNIKTKAEAIDFPKGDLHLLICHRCGFIYNSTFDPNLVSYSSDCEESQGFSKTFNTFSMSLVKNLIEKYDLRNKKIVEIGCGKGEFLEQICDFGNNIGVGFDPAYVPGRGSKNPKNITFIKDYFSKAYAGYHGDFICCRMTLEHIQETGDFIKTIRDSIENHPRTIVFFQVPDITRILKCCAFEDLYYEHCSYFSAGSLARLFRHCGFQILDIQTAFDQQYVLMDAGLDKQKIGQIFLQENDLESILQETAMFQDRYLSKINYWNTVLLDNKTKGKRVVIWGSGSKGVAFLNGLKHSNGIEFAVDINPYRQGTYMAGTGQKIETPDFLAEYKPSVVIIMNDIYKKEIQECLNQMDLHPEVLTL